MDMVIRGGTGMYMGGNLIVECYDVATLQHSQVMTCQSRAMDR